MLYYSDFEKSNSNENDLHKFIKDAIDQWETTTDYATAGIAEQYDRCENVTIKQIKKYLYDTCGNKYEDVFAANNKIATNVFNKLLTWTTQYSLANGVNYAEGVTVDDAIGKQIDSDTAKALRLAMRDGYVFSFYNGEKTTMFPLTEFVPLYDEKTGTLMAGIRFFRVSEEKPTSITLYEQDGFTSFVDDNGKMSTVQEKRAYKLKIKSTAAGGVTDVEDENPNSLPIVKLKGNQYGISFLNFVRDKIDAYDLTLSGLANDLDENAFVYFILKNNGNLSDEDIARIKRQLKTAKLAVVDTEDGGDFQHFTKDIPTTAREVMLEKLMQEIYSAWMAVDMDKLASGAVNEDQINAMYANADNRASEVEDEVKGYIQTLLEYKNIAVPDYKIFFIRNKLQSQLKDSQVDQIKVNTIVTASTAIDDETLLETLKNNTTLFADIDINEIMQKKGVESLSLVDYAGKNTEETEQNNIDTQAE